MRLSRRDLLKTTAALAAAGDRFDFDLDHSARAFGPRFFARRAAGRPDPSVAGGGHRDVHEAACSPALDGSPDRQSARDARNGHDAITRTAYHVGAFGPHCPHS